MTARRSPEGYIRDPIVADGPRGAAYYRVGTVSARDVKRGRVRVTFDESDNLESWWLAVAFRRSHADQEYDLPDVGDVVACVMDPLEEQGVVLGAVYSVRDHVPEGATGDMRFRRYHDGTTIFYDRAAHLLKASFPDGAELHYDAAAHELLAKAADGGTINVKVSGGTVNVNCDQASINADSAVDVTTGTATVTADSINLNGQVTVT